jgi:hypothetical protein
VVQTHLFLPCLLLQLAVAVVVVAVALERLMVYLVVRVVGVQGQMVR